MSIKLRCIIKDMYWCCLFELVTFLVIKRQLINKNKEEKKRIIKYHLLRARRKLIYITTTILQSWHPPGSHLLYVFRLIPPLLNLYIHLWLTSCTEYFHTPIISFQYTLTVMSGRWWNSTSRVRICISLTKYFHSQFDLSVHWWMASSALDASLWDRK